MISDTKGWASADEGRRYGDDVTCTDLRDRTRNLLTVEHP
jgi:hypothetical protein